MPAGPSMHDELLLLDEGVWARTRTRLDGLTPEELFWEPADGCWTVRPLADGSWITDGAVPSPRPAPFTTLAWRVMHLVGCYGSVRNSRWVGVEVDDPPLEAWMPPARTPEQAIDLLERAHARWRAVLEAADDECLATLIGPIGGQYAEADRAGLLIHQFDEVIHHGAEIALLRDLYRATHEPAHRDPAVAALLVPGGAVTDEAILAGPRDTRVTDLAELGRWDLVERAVALGLPVEGPAAPTALHRAAGAGHVRLVEALLAAGADATRTDPDWSATPAGWAEFFGHRELVARLRP